MDPQMIALQQARVASFVTQKLQAIAQLAALDSVALLFLEPFNLVIAMGMTWTNTDKDRERKTRGKPKERQQNP